MNVHAPKLSPFDVVPTEADVVIVGGGIVGMSTALFLARKGVSVVVCEKGAVGEKQSSRNWGWLRKMGRDSREMPLIVEALRMWERLNQTVEAETGFRAAGTLFVCDIGEGMEKRARWLDVARPYQLNTRMLNSSELAELMPVATRRFKGALIPLKGELS